MITRATYIARDLRDLAVVHDLARFERFVRLCAGRVGQLLNLTSLGNDAGVSHTPRVHGSIYYKPATSFSCCHPGSPTPANA